MQFFKRNLLSIIVFITGGAVLIIEVTAFRILAPYFGNTLYSTSSIIGVVLGALSFGYYLGGILADTYPRHSLFFLLIILAGISSFFIQGLSQILLPIVSSLFSIVIGPPVASFFLFFLPSLILGMMSPFAIKLKSLQQKGIGRISGSIFFWSTLGSIAGSFAAGFFLIPSFGIQTIIISTSSFLILIGVLGLVFTKQDPLKNFSKGQKLFFFFAFVFVLTSSLFLTLPKPEQVLFQKDGLYSRVVIKEGEINDKKIRVLQLDRAIEGGIFLESDELPFLYTRYYSLYKIFYPQAEKALFLGGGAYSTPRKLLSEINNIKKIDVVEIDPQLYALAKEYFMLKDDERLFNHIADGRRFLRKANENYDFIFTDVYYSISSIPVHFTTKEFFQLAKDRLSQDGFFVMNIIGQLKEGADQLILSEIKTFRSVFKSSYFFAVDSPNKKSLQNFIFLGFRNDSQMVDFSKPEILTHESEVIRQLPEKVVAVKELNLSSAYLLTDNFAPIEYLTAKMMARIQ